MFLELRLKQQYFWCCASLHDIVRRFKKTKRPWSEFPEQVAIQLNDTHPTLAIVELQRILIDIENVAWDQAWKIVTSTFGYTNHTVMQEALEKWPVPLMTGLLPRHMQIIYDINLFFLQTVEKKYPKVLQQTPQTPSNTPLLSSSIILWLLASDQNLTFRTAIYSAASPSSKNRVPNRSAWPTSPSSAPKRSTA